VRDRPLIDWDWVLGHLDDIGEATLEHIQLTFIAIAVGLAISLAASFLIYRDRRFYAPLTGISGFLYTIPSLALFAFLIPITGLSVLTAEIGLVSYTLLILIRNIVAGLDGVPADIREAAMGMGYGPSQRLIRVELPLALPVIVAGVRIATVTIVGLVTVAGAIGQGGLGGFMLRGFSRSFPTQIYVGAVLTVALAIAIDVGLQLVQRRLTPWARARGR
jgi:osmoprotectant transport system permease protein